MMLRRFFPCIAVMVTVSFAGVVFAQPGGTAGARTEVSFRHEHAENRIVVEFRLSGLAPNSNVQWSSQGERSQNHTLAPFSWGPERLEWRTDDTGSVSFGVYHYDWGSYTYTFRDDRGRKICVPVSYGRDRKLPAPYVVREGEYDETGRRLRPQSPLQWPRDAIGAWVLPNGDTVRIHADGRFEMSNAEPGRLTEMRDGCYIVTLPNRRYYKIDIRVINNTTINITFVIEATGERRPHTARRDTTEGTSTPGQGSEGGGGGAVVSGTLPLGQRTGRWEYLTRLVPKAGHWRSDHPGRVHFEGAVGMNSYWVGQTLGVRSYGGVWTLAAIRDKHGPVRAIELTLGMRDETDVEAVWRVELRLDTAAPFEVDVRVGRPYRTVLDATRFNRMEIGVRHLAGSVRAGGCVIYEPKVYF